MAQKNEGTLWSFNPHGPKSLPEKSELVTPNPTWPYLSPSPPCLEIINSFPLLLG